MKRKLLTVFLALIVTISIVGTWYYASYPTIGVGKLVASSSDKFEKEFHSERLSITSAVIGFLYCLSFAIDCKSENQTHD